MKKTISTIASLLILVQGMFSFVDFSFLLNETIADYKLHQNKYGDDLITFFSKHFGDLKEQHLAQHRKEHQEHKHNHEMNFSVQIDMLWDNPNDYDANFNTVFYKKNNFTYKDLFSSFEKQKIFQPPRT